MSSLFFDPASPDEAIGDDWFADDDSAVAGIVEKVTDSVAAPLARQPSRTESTALFFDIETVPDYSRLESFGLDPLPKILPEAASAECPEIAALLKSGLEVIEKKLLTLNPTDEYLDAVASAEALAEKPRVGVGKAVAAVRAARERVKNAAGDRRKLLSVTPEYCRIAALGWAVGSGRVESLTCGEHADCDTTDERELLTTFWSLALDARPLIGFNVLHFDLRVLFVRSALLGVMPSRLLDCRPYGSRDVLDLMLVRFGSVSQAMGLKKLAPLYGIEVPAGDCDGSQVEELMRTDPNKVGLYVASDVAVTRELYRRMAGFFCQ